MAETSERGVVRTAKKFLFREEQPLYFSFEIGMCNAHMPCPFSKAFVEAPQFGSDLFFGTQNEDIVGMHLRTLFSKAFEVVKQDDEHGIKIDRLGSTSENQYSDQVEALKCLDNFLANYREHEKALKSVLEKQETETQACDVLAVHIFEQLVPGGNVIISKSMRGQTDECPCGCKRKLTFGDTGIGHPSVWHGFPDMLVRQTAIKLIVDETGEEEEDEEVKSGDSEGPSSPKSTKIEKKHTFDMVSRCQLPDIDATAQCVSQAVTNGYSVKNQMKLANVKHEGFVPSIGCTLKEMSIFLHDPDHDILLRRKKSLVILCEVDNEFRLHLGNLVELWLMLNAHVFGSSIQKEKIPQFIKSGVKSFLEAHGRLSVYEKSLSYRAEKTELSKGQRSCEFKGDTAIKII